MKYLLFALLFGCSLALTPGVDAKTASDSCAIYKTLSGSLPASASKILKAGKMLRVCAGRFDGDERYFVRDLPWKGRFNVCHFEEQPLFRVKAITGEDVFVDTPGPLDAPNADAYAVVRKSYMLVASDACPAQDDDRYVPTMAVSEGVFAALTTLVNRLGGSEQSFSRACFLMKPSERQEQDITYNRFKVALNPAVHIGGISLSEQGARGEGAARYNIVASNPNNESGFLSIGAELTDSGFCVTSMAFGMQ